MPVWTLLAAVADSLDLFVPNILLKKFIPQRGCLPGDLSRAVVDRFGGCLSPCALYGRSIVPFSRLHAGQVSPGAGKGSLQSQSLLKARSVKVFACGQSGKFRSPRCFQSMLGVRKARDQQLLSKTVKSRCIHCNQFCKPNRSYVMRRD